MLDMHLPGVSGEQIHAMMAERGEAHRVIICSADVQLVERYRSIGARALTKPAPMTELQRVVQEVVCQGEPAHGSAS
jgi:FixJ family two-component response regulator